MKSWKCPNCKRERNSGDNIKLKMCGCGEYMVEKLNKVIGDGRH